jgi:glycogen(starch) synthase
MHVLMTADTVGGVWTYTRELVTQLSKRDIQITLVSFGEIPSAAQTEWLEALPNVSYRPTAFKLEWMQDAQDDLRASAEFLTSVAEEVQPDLLHSNQYFFGALAIDVPKLVVAHSDVVSWWYSVHGSGPPESDWITHYRENVNAGLAGATAVVAPSQWMLDQAVRHYTVCQQRGVIYNGRDPQLFLPHMSKGDYAISVGRLWDAGKQATLLLRDTLAMPVMLVGSERNPDELVASTPLAKAAERLIMKGPQSEAQLRFLMGRALVYVATSRYEPFGLAPLEAALSRCALVTNDIPPLREIWGEDALYFQTNDAQSLTEKIQQLASNPTKRADYADRALNRARGRFNSQRMAEEYLELYRKLVPATVAAA